MLLPLFSPTYPLSPLSSLSSLSLSPSPSLLSLSPSPSLLSLSPSPLSPGFSLFLPPAPFLNVPISHCKLRPQVRAATFSLVSTACRQLQELVQSNTKQFCSTVLGSLAESEPVVIGPLWEATLQVVTQTEVWTRHKADKSHVQPRPFVQLVWESDTRLISLVSRPLPFVQLVWESDTRLISSMLRPLPLMCN